MNNLNLPLLVLVCLCVAQSLVLGSHFKNKRTKISNSKFGSILNAESIGDQPIKNSLNQSINNSIKSSFVSFGQLFGIQKNTKLQEGFDGNILNLISYKNGKNKDNQISYQNLKEKAKKDSKPMAMFRQFLVNSLSFVMAVVLMLSGLNTPQVKAQGNPTATLSTPATNFIGTEVTFTASFNNTGTVGYGPYLDVYLPTNGADGNNGSSTKDGLSFTSASYLGSAVSSKVLVFPASASGNNPCGGGQTPVTHPYARDSSDKPLLVCGNPGDQLVVLMLPFGSFTPGQPIADISIKAALSNLADLNTPLPIKATAGFQYGNDPLNNPESDPTIVSSPTTAMVTPSLITTKKVYLGPENETATGPNFPRQYTISAEIAPGQTINNFTLTDKLPNNIIFTKVISSSPSGATIIPPSSTTAPTNNAQLSLMWNSMTGGTIPTYTFEYYVSDKDANGNTVLPANSGAFSSSFDNAFASGSWTPLDSRDATTQVNTSSTPSTHTLQDKSIATQKSLVNKSDPSGRAKPGNILEYTINFQISDYFAFDNIVETDTFTDGQRLDPSSPLTLTVTDQDGTKSGNFSIGNNVIKTDKIGNNPTNVDASSDGSTTLSFQISNLLKSLGDDGIIKGGLISSGANKGAGVGKIVFQTIVQDKFSDDYNSNTQSQSLSLNDVLGNKATITGDVLNNATLTKTGSSQSDSTAASIMTEGGTLVKTIYAINGDTNVAQFGATPSLSANDTVTYRLEFTLPQSDVQGFSLVDYLPLPIFHSNTFSTSFGTGINATPPAANQTKFGPTHTFGPSGIATPVVSIDNDVNSIKFDFGNYQDLTNSPSKVDILLTGVIGDEPIGDGVPITNQVRSFSGSTNGVSQTADAIININVTEPNIKITKGIVGTDNPSASYTLNPNSPKPFTAPNTSGCSRFSGTINSAGLLSTPIDSDLQNSDASDNLRYAVVLENVGTGKNGAFGVIAKDMLSANLINPRNVCVTLGDGTVLNEGSDYVKLGNGFHDQGIKLLDPSATQGKLTRYDANSGKNIVIISYDATIGANVIPKQSVINKATLTNYTTTPNGFNLAYRNPSDTAATVQVKPPKITKKIVSTTEDSTTGNNVAIGEQIKYHIDIEIPEGTIPQMKVLDILDDGLAFVSCDNSSVSNPTDVTATGGSFTNLCSKASVSNNGRTVIFDVGDTTNKNADNNVTEILSFDYTAVVLNQANNIKDAERYNNVYLTWVDTSNNNQANQSEAKSDAVKIVEPRLNTVKTVDNTLVDAGDVVTYTIKLSHNVVSNSNAYNTVMTDQIPNNLTFVQGSENLSGSATGGVFSFDSASRTIAVKYDNIALGQEAILTFKASVNTGVKSLQVINNEAKTVWTSLPIEISTPVSTFNPNSIERTGTGNINDYNSQNNIDITVNAIVPVKSLISTSEPLTKVVNGQEKVTIGEIVRYALVVKLPESTNDGLKITDNIPTGMQFINDGTAKYSTVSDKGVITFMPNCNITGSNPTVTPTCVIPNANISGGTTDGSAVTFDFGQIDNQDSDANDEYIVVEFNAKVLNTANNQAFNNANVNSTPTTLTNTFSVVLNGNTPIVSNNITVGVAEPVINNLATTITATPHDAGDPLEYTITFSNTATGDNASPAFNINVNDALENLQAIDPNADIVITKPDGTKVINNSSSQTLSLIFDQLLPGESITIVIKGKVEQSVPAGTRIVNNTDIKYSSIPNGTGTQNNPTGSVSGATGTTTGGRDGSETAGALNDYSSQSSTKTTIDTPTITQAPVNPSYAVGETVTFNLLVTLPEGLTPDLHIQDLLPAGLKYLSSTVITEAGASNGLLTNDFNGQVNEPGVNINPDGSIDFKFGDVTVKATPTTTGNQFVLSIVALVENIPSNQDGTTFKNPASLTYADRKGNPVLVESPITTTIKVIEPVLAIIKTIVNPTTVDAGDKITYSLDINHTKASTGDAHNVTITDIIPTDLENIKCESITAGATVPLTCADVIINGNSVSITDKLLKIGETISVKISGTIIKAENFVSTVKNTADLKWNSFNSDEARTGADGTLNDGSLNDYSASSDTSFVTKNETSITKELTATSDTTTLGNVVAIGEKATYKLTVKLVEGSDKNFVITDNLPVGMEYVPGSINTTNDSNIVFGNQTITGGTDGAALNIAFDKITNTADNDGSNDFFVISIDARATGNPANISGATLTNTANVKSDNTKETVSNPITVTIAEPKLTITKDIVETTGTVSDIANIVLTVKNEGNATAYGVVVNDPIDPTKFDSIINTSTDTNLIFDGSVPSMVTYKGNLPAGATATLKFKIKLTAGVIADEVITNKATVSEYYSTLTKDKKYDQVSATDTIKITAPDLVVTIDDTKTVVTPSESVKYTVIAKNIGDAVSTGTVITLSLPANTTFDVANSDAGWVLNTDGTYSLTVGTMNPNDSKNYIFAVIVNPSVPTGTNSLVATAVIKDDLTHGPERRSDNNTSTDTDEVKATPSYTLTKDDGKTIVTAGDELTYTLTAKNTGNQDGVNVVITDTIPNDVAFVSASNGGTILGSTITFPATNLKAGETITRTVVIKVDSPIGHDIKEIVNTANLVDSLNLTATAKDIDTIDGKVNIKLTNDDTGISSYPTGSVVYNLTVTNIGNIISIAPTITETVPAGSTFDPSTSDPRWVSQGNGIYTLTLDNLAGNGGTTGIIKFGVIVNDSSTNTDGLLNNPATVVDKNDNKDDATDTTPIKTVDVVVTKSDDGIKARPKDTIIYTVNYKNQGTQDATGVTITETVPNNTTFVLAQSSTGWSCADQSVAGTICTYTVGNLNAGISINTLKFAVFVLKDTPDLTIITNNISIKDDVKHGQETNYGNNIFSLTTATHIPLSTITGQVFIDTNGNGTMETSETNSVPTGTTVTLTDTTDPNKIYTVPLNSDGTYSVIVTSSTYSVVVNAPTGYVITPATDTGAGTGANPTVLTVNEGETKSAGKDGLYLPASISGTVIADLNGDGIIDTNETGIAGATVTLYNKTTGLAIGTPITVGTNGQYTFGNLSAGDYYVKITNIPATYILSGNPTATPTTDNNFFLISSQSNTITITSGNDIKNVDALINNMAILTGQVYLDNDANGKQDNNEPNSSATSPIPTGTIVQIIDKDGNIVATPTLNPDGTYSQPVVAGTYTVKVIAPTGYLISDSSQNGAGTGANPTVVTLAAGQTIDAGKDGLYTNGSIKGNIFMDINNDANQGTNEPNGNIPAGTIVKILDKDGNVVATPTVNPDGSYITTTLLPGVYTIQMVTPTGYTISTPALTPVTVISNQTATVNPVGLYIPGTIVGKIFMDGNVNGTQDTTEPNGNLPAGTTVTMTDGANNYTVPINPDGTYSQSVVPGSNYTVTINYPAGYTMTNGSNVTTVTALPNVTVDAGKRGLYTPPTAGLDLKVNITDDGITSYPNGVIIYTINYANIGSLDATGVKLSDIIPAGTVFDPANSTPGWSVTNGGNSGSGATFNIGNLAVGQYGTIKLAVKVKPNTPITAIIKDTVGISNDGTHGPDINTSNNNANETTPLMGQPASSSSATSSTISSTVSSANSSTTNSSTGSSTAISSTVTGSSTIPTSSSVIASSSTITTSSTITSSSATTSSSTPVSTTNSSTNTSSITTGSSTTSPSSGTNISSAVATSSTASSIITNSSITTSPSSTPTTTSSTATGSSTPVSITNSSAVAPISSAVATSSTVTTGSSIITTGSSTTNGSSTVATSSSGGGIDVIVINPSSTATGSSTVATSSVTAGSSTASGSSTANTSSVTTVSSETNNSSNTNSSTTIGSSTSTSSSNPNSSSATNSSSSTNSSMTSSSATSSSAKPLDLSIKKTTNHTAFLPNQSIAYNLKVENLGQTTATGTTITEIIPANTTFESANSTAGWVCDNTGAGSLCIFNINTINPGQVINISFGVKVDPIVTNPIYNQTGVSQDGINGDDINSDNDNSDISTPVLNSSDVVTISGRLFFDTNNDGIQENDETSTNLPAGTEITITNGIDTYTAIVGLDGYYSVGVIPGDYTISFVIPASYNLTTPNNVSVKAVSGQTTPIVKVGIYKAPAPLPTPISSAVSSATISSISLPKNPNGGQTTITVNNGSQNNSNNSNNNNSNNTQTNNQSNKQSSSQTNSSSQNSSQSSTQNSVSSNNTQSSTEDKEDLKLLTEKTGKSLQLPRTGGYSHEVSIQILAMVIILGIAGLTVLSHNKAKKSNKK